MPTCGDCDAGPRVQPPPVPSAGVRSYHCNRQNVIVPLNVRPEKDSMRVPLGRIYRWTKWSPRKGFRAERKRKWHHKFRIRMSFGPVEFQERTESGLDGSGFRGGGEAQTWEIKLTFIDCLLSAKSFCICSHFEEESFVPPWFPVLGWLQEGSWLWRFLN